MQVSLKVAAGSHAGKEIAIANDRFLIGRSDDCQLRPKSDSISRRHCVIAVREGRVLIQDLKSRNGTYVNEKRLQPDRAKILKAGDKIRVGKLEFEIVIAVSVGGPKKPVVKDLADAADRTVKSAGDSRFEDVDIGSWLDEADQIDRVRKTADPDTRQLKLDETSTLSAESGEISISDDDDSQPGDKRVPTKRPEKKAPGKLPKNAGAQTSDSREAADEALKKFFGGR